MSKLTLKNISRRYGAVEAVAGFLAFGLRLDAERKENTDVEEKRDGKSDTESKLTVHCQNLSLSGQMISGRITPPWRSYKPSGFPNFVFRKAPKHITERGACQEAVFKTGELNPVEKANALRFWARGHISN